MVLSIREGSKTCSSGAAADAAADVAAGAGFWQNAGTAASTNAIAREKRQGEALKQNMPQTLADLGLRKHRHGRAGTITNAESNSPRSTTSGATHLQHRQAGRGSQRLHRSHSGRDRKGWI